MSIPIQLPHLGTGARAVRVSTWFVELGDRVEAGDQLVEVAIPGITFDVSAPCPGIIASIETREGDVVLENGTLGRIEQA